MGCSSLTATGKIISITMLDCAGSGMRSMEASDEIEEIEIIAPANTGAWRVKDRFYPNNWNIQILTSKSNRLGLSKLQTRRGGKVLNMSTGGVAYRVYKSIEAVPGDRILVQLDKCKRDLVLAHYNAVIEVIRVCDGSVICARFVNTSWDLINAIESNLQEA